MSEGLKIALSIVTIFLLFGCSETSQSSKVEDGIIITDVRVRSSTAELALDVAEVHRGDLVKILDHRAGGWLKVRTAKGAEGWIEAYAVARQPRVQAANALAEQTKGVTPQAIGQLSGPTTLRMSPGRASDENVITMLPRGTVVQILDRQRTRKQDQEIIPKRYHPAASLNQSPSSASESDAGQQSDYWYQVRLPEQPIVRAGWIYAPAVTLQIPPRLVHFQSDYNITGWFEVGQVEDPEVGPAVHYLVLERHRFRPVPGTDFNRLHLFIWNAKAHLYRSTWQPVDGILPVLRETQDNTSVFRVKAYNRKTGELGETKFFVDVANPGQPRLKAVSHQGNDKR